MTTLTTPRECPGCKRTFAVPTHVAAGWECERCRHAPATLYCHECHADVPAVRVSRPGAPVFALHADEYDCPTCGAPILCDECGDTWSDNHPDH